MEASGRQLNKSGDQHGTVDVGLGMISLETGLEDYNQEGSSDRTLFS